MADKRRIQRWATTAVVAAVGVWVAREAGGILGADWQAAMAQQNVAAWTTGQQKWTNEDWVEAREDLKAAVRLNPDDPVLYESLATLHALRGLAEWGTGLADSPGMGYYRQAIEYQMHSMRLRPNYPYGWGNLAYLHYSANDTNDKIFAAWDEALRLGPNEKDLHAWLLHVAHLGWRVTPDHVRAWVEKQAPGSSDKFEAELDAADAAYAASLEKDRMAADAAAAAAAAERDRVAAQERAERNARAPAFQSLIATPGGQAALPR